MSRTLRLSGSQEEIQRQIQEFCEKNEIPKDKLYMYSIEFATTENQVYNNIENPQNAHI